MPTIAIASSGCMVELAENSVTTEKAMAISSLVMACVPGRVFLILFLRLCRSTYQAHTAALAIGGSRIAAGVEILLDAWKVARGAEFREAILRALSISRQDSAIDLEHSLPVGRILLGSPQIQQPSPASPLQILDQELDVLGAALARHDADYQAVLGIQSHLVPGVSLLEVFGLVAVALLLLLADEIIE